VTRAAMLAHCRTLTMACNYTEGENMVCVLDFKREVGLWHSVLTSVLNGMHVVFIPYALMKVNPASWMQMITKHRGTYSSVQTQKKKNVAIMWLLIKSSCYSLYERKCTHKQSPVPI
jgi:acyl-coenzyme A synthetase/AMP-(fatty) acid ligase